MLSVKNKYRACFVEMIFSWFSYSINIPPFFARVGLLMENTISAVQLGEMYIYKCHPLEFGRNFSEMSFRGDNIYGCLTKFKIQVRSTLVLEREWTAVA
jgi:hypothetical protein